MKTFCHAGLYFCSKPERDCLECRVSLCSARGSSETLHSTTAGAWDAGGRAVPWAHCRSEGSASYLFSIVVFYAEIFHSLQGELNYS